MCRNTGYGAVMVEAYRGERNERLTLDAGLVCPLDPLGRSAVSVVDVVATLSLTGWRFEFHSVDP